MNDVWNNLKVDQKGRLMDIYLKAGITSLDEMKDHFNRYMDESAIEDPAGQWAHPGEVTRIPSGEITMKGVPYPVLGVSDTGDTKMMYPDRDYSFNGNSVTEYPMTGREYQYGGNIKKERKDFVKSVNERSNADFVKRLLDPNRKYITNPDGTISTHKLSWATDDNGNAVVYPNIQTTPEGLKDFSDKGWTAYERAIETGDTLMMTPEQADWFTKNYKKYYPKGKTFQYGGDVVLSGGNMIRAKDERMASRLAGVPESYISNVVYDSGSKSYIPVYNLRPVNVTARTPSYIMSLSPEERENIARGETYAQEFSRRHNETGKKFMPLAMTAAAAPLAAFAEPIAAVARPITTVASKPFGTALNAVGRIAPKLSSRYASQAALADGIYDIAMTADGVRNAFSDEGIQKTARLAEEGDVYGAVKSGIGDIMNLAGAYSTTNKIAAVARPKTRYDAVYDMAVPVVRTVASTKPGKRMAESVMRASSNSNLDAEDVKSALKNNAGYIFTGKNPKFGFYNGTTIGGKARKDDLISAYLYGNKLNSKRADFIDNISYGVHDDYVTKNYPHLYGKIPVYEVGELSEPAMERLRVNPHATSVNGPMSYRTNNPASDDFGYDTAGHLIVHDNGDVYEQDIWKFNPSEYRNKYGYDDRNTMMINDLGLNFIDAAGTPVILRSKPMKHPYR